MRIEARTDGSLLLTGPGGARWGAALASLGIALFLVSLLATGEAGVLGAVVVVPLAVIALLAGLAAARHRDWILFDRRAREVVFRRGLASIFRPVAVVSFDDVEAIVVEATGSPPGGLEVRLHRAGDIAWPIEANVDSAEVSRLVAALQAVGDWPVVHDGELPAGAGPRPAGAQPLPRGTPPPGSRSSSVRP